MFSCVRPRRGRSLSTWFRLAFHRPSFVWRAFVIWCIVAMTRCPLYHATIGDGLVVIDVGLDRDRFFPTSWYIEHKPNLAWAFIVPTPWEPIVDCHQLIERKKPWQWPRHNCIAVCVRQLTAAGVILDSTPRTPKGLYDALRAAGYDQLDCYEPS